MTEEELKHIAQTILVNQYLMLKFMELIEKMLKRTGMDIRME